MRIITKSSGEQESFMPDKFKRSLQRAGVSLKVSEILLQEVLDRPELDTTQKVYDYAFHRLREINSPVAARYSLKSALYELGPEGFLFERFMAEVFKAQGYRTRNDVILSGMCVDHEVDIIMEKGTTRYIAECKFHNQRGIKTDVKVTLYVKARFLDLSAHWEKSSQPSFTGVWLLTNTQLTLEAIKYGTCAGVNLLGWSYPEQGNIAQLIDTLGLHPITSITCLTSRQKKFLLERNILLASELLDRPDLLKELGFTPEQIAATTEELRVLCKPLR